jgi:putative MFS transporter
MNPIKITRKKTSFTEIFSSKYVRATIFISVFWFSYDVAFYGIGLFNPTILGALGLSKTRALLGSAVFSVMAVVGSVLCIAFIDKIGRKKITLIGFVGMTISLFVLAILALRIPKDAFSMASVSAAIIAMFILFEVTQTMGPGSTDLIYPQELYPTSIRATGQGWGTSFSRVGAILGLTVFPTLMDVFGLGYGLLFFFVFALLGIIVTLLLGVETTGKSLEELTR